MYFFELFRGIVNLNQKKKKVTLQSFGIILTPPPILHHLGSMILLGSVQRFELERLLLVHLSKEQKVLWSWSGHTSNNGRNADSDSSSSTSRGSSPTKQQIHSAEPVTAGGDSASDKPVINNVALAGNGATGPGIGVPVTGPRFRVTRVNETEIGTKKQDEPDGNGEAIPMKLLSMVSEDS